MISENERCKHRVEAARKEIPADALAVLGKAAEWIQTEKDHTLDDYFLIVLERLMGELSDDTLDAILNYNQQSSG